ncbi:MAG: hypothetical protein K2N38_14315 [Oscillospiraceae bacterium]|nr:hypothetical protein [Oscillospiraceae bacterium]
MNEQNLPPIRSTEEAREKGARGGVKSGVTRRRKRDLRAAMKELLELPVTDTELWNSISTLGVDPKNINNCAALVVALFSKAARGDVAAFKEIRSLMGEDKDAERLKLQREQLKNSSDGMLSDVLEALKNDDLKE